MSFLGLFNHVLLWAAIVAAVFGPGVSCGMRCGGSWS